ncbi:hypothetical protein QVG61_08485 [Thiohalobacter sp. IOR34]|uniref:hypothetical protein n=1 Tax=Thiohalobacter sp. IOR34 TaxID=3057176 RepID=UPI0025B12F4C|nr:hypothetical protein [Thiohalobacter sp. IOR34]WJW74543.1 hypothetical protein QVG61_08485 [Thiohalobacter sp. IOR34]
MLDELLSRVAESEVRLWPLAIGWTLVSLLHLYGWRRPAWFATAGMLIVSYAVLSVALRG